MPASHTITPLAERLGLKPGMRTLFVDVPTELYDAIDPHAAGLELLAAPCTGIDAALIVASERAKLACELNALRQLIAPGGFVWVSWRSDAEAAAIKTNEGDVCEAAEAAGLRAANSGSFHPGWSSLKLRLSTPQS